MVERDICLSSQLAIAVSNGSGDLVLFFFFQLNFNYFLWYFSMESVSMFLNNEIQRVCANHGLLLFALVELISQSGGAVCLFQKTTFFMGSRNFGVSAVCLLKTVVSQRDCSSIEESKSEIFHLGDRLLLVTIVVFY
mmetsp:Transcript_28151/g.36885  ORF Transcript_28151/g.36885 Transcript_28151/m.36885 type:complete len:137 (+) Transcript_28151:1424-1834(+)